jgi:glycerol dehydrogenase-like iron-containing ADH family enzyme
MRQQYFDTIKKSYSHFQKFLFPGKIIKINGGLEKNVSKNLSDGKSAIIYDKYVRSIFIKKVNVNIFDEEITFDGECCPEEFRRVFLVLKERKIRNLVAAGGGKVLDVAKYVKKELPEISLINVPTSSATCAAFTPISVIYNRDGSYLNTLDTVPPDVLIIDYEFFMDLPLVFFAAGIMDTLSKFYETETFYKNEKKKIFYDNFTRDLALVLKRNVFKKIKKSKKCLNDEDRIFFTDCNIIYSGLISCVGIKTVTSSIAHAIAHAMTVIPKARGYLHGEHVSVSLLIQEQLMENKKNVDDVGKITGKIDMPDRLSGVGVLMEELSLLCSRYLQIKRNEKIYVPVDDNLMYNVMEKRL